MIDPLNEKREGYLYYLEQILDTPEKFHQYFKEEPIYQTIGLFATIIGFLLKEFLEFKYKWDIPDFAGISIVDVLLFPFAGYFAYLLVERMWLKESEDNGMELFDDIERTYEGPSGYAEPEFHFLNRSARKYAANIRDVLETWFNRYPDSEKNDLYERFRSIDDRQHYGAFFELFLHEMLIRLKCKVISHSETNADSTKLPDFLVTCPNGDKFYLEAVVSTNKSEEDWKRQKILNIVYDLLDKKYDSPNFFIGINILVLPKTQPPSKRICKFLDEHFKALDPDEMGEIMKGGLHKLPHRTFEHDDWEIEFYPIPKAKESRGKEGSRPVGSKMGRVQKVMTGEFLRKALISKAKRYGKLEYPFIIAVNSLEWAMENDESLD